MGINELRVKRFTNTAILPTRAHDNDAGLDLYSPEDATIHFGSRVKINLHIGVAIPEGYVGLILDRSSMGNKGVRTLGGVIDAGYRGEVQAILAYVADERLQDGSISLGFQSVDVRRGDKIAQMIIVPVLTPAVVEVDEFETTTRNDSGFGSTGR